MALGMFGNSMGRWGSRSSFPVLPGDSTVGAAPSIVGDGNYPMPGWRSYVQPPLGTPPIVNSAPDQTNGSPAIGALMQAPAPPGSANIGPTDGMPPPISSPDMAERIPLPSISMQTPDLSHYGKPGFFSAGGLGLKLLGGISDGVLGANGMAPVYGPAMAARQQQQDLMRRQQMQQQAEFQRQIALEEYKRAHPEPTEFEKTMLAGGYQPGTPAYADLAGQKARADAMGTPFVYEQYNPTTGATDKVIAPRTSIPGMTAPSPGGGMAVGTVVAGHRYLGGPTSDPRSWQEVGGAAPTAPSPFHRP